ncbi:hypothetical protein ESP131_09575 [Exiguobacterium sp. U13-1]|uniref:DUF4825 domain-containing protein n=1 Tax=Exiguobacterium acetylicum TaxID=41170 RepID=A0ABX8GDM6_EXIAC|nr:MULTISPECIES: DUF4825 domain-containing protein [Exiguobacterium]AOT00489.1 hypothetical protein ESP131_09575 [Exiguobacterium sp. U13-1]QWB31453.1 DUF4825 domain-containing protein [Exiguobacterium acetylicum]
MKKTVGAIVLAGGMLILGGCGTAATQTDLFKQQGTYLGDNSNVRDIVQQLPHGDQLKKIELSTKDKPYQLTLRYAGYEEGQVEQKSNHTAIYNATALFTLIPNVDHVNMTIEDASYHFTKQQLRDWYGKDFTAYDNEKALKAFTKPFIEDSKKVNDLLN